MTHLEISNRDPRALKGDALAILVLNHYQWTRTGKLLDAEAENQFSKALHEDSFQVKRKNISVLFTGRNPVKRLFVTAFPVDTTSRANELRIAAFASTRLAQNRGVRNFVIAFDPKNNAEVQAIAEGALLAGYEFHPYQKKKESNKKKIDKITVCATTDRGGVSAVKARIHAGAEMLVRDLVNEPPNTMNSIRLADAAHETAKKHDLQIKIYEPNELEQMGAGAFLSVGKGSVLPSRMIHITYMPRTEARTHVALVGKGITFDSGGLSLKTEKGMEHMKSDMAGAAIVLACVRAAQELRLPVQVSGIMMVTENMPNGGANRPGDVVRAMNGKTIEITNTDAEGRLALADGLTFAQGLSPDYVLDIATLTGAQVVALGRLVGAVMGNSEELNRRIAAAGEKSGETIWPLPLYEPYRELIKSDIADVRNSSGIPEAGSIQAGLFLSEFVTHPQWAHLDIAGPAWQEREWSLYTRSASGFGTRCLLRFLAEEL